MGYIMPEHFFLNRRRLRFPGQEKDWDFFPAKRGGDRRLRKWKVHGALASEPPEWKF